MRVEPYVFRDIQMISDARVTPLLDRCLDCREPLRTITATDANTMLLAAQCPTCKKVYILDSLTA